MDTNPFSLFSKSTYNFLNNSFVYFSSTKKYNAGNKSFFLHSNKTSIIVLSTEYSNFSSALIIYLSFQDDLFLKINNFIFQ